MIKQWANKDPAENFVVEFDFSSSSTTINAATITVTLLSGTDNHPSAMLSGPPVFAAGIVRQRLNAGQPGCRYQFNCVASDGTGIFVLDTTLAVAYADTGQVVITDYTNYDEVRAALGVTVDEVGNEVLGLPMYGNHLGMELDELDATLIATYAGISALSLPTRSAAQKRLFSAVGLFATYAVARHLGTSLPMMGPKSISDGRAVVTRFSDSPYKATLARIEAQYERTRSSVLSALAALNSSSVADIRITYMGVAPPSTDPVVGS